MNDLPELSKVTKSKTGGYFVYAQATYYPDFVRIYIPRTPQLKGYEESAFDRISNSNISAKETNLERAIRKSRKSIKDYALNNDFEHFVTLTIASDRQDIQRSKNKIVNWIKNEKKRKGKFDYLVVPEFHDDHKSLHYHAVFKGYKGAIEQVLLENGKPRKHKGSFVYKFPSYTLGFQTIKLIDNQIDTKTKVAFYIQKYITKDMPVLFGKNRYWTSRGLKKPIKEDNPEQWYKFAIPDRRHDSDYGTILDFNRGKQTLVDMFLDAHLEDRN